MSLCSPAALELILSCYICHTASKLANLCSEPFLHQRQKAAVSPTSQVISEAAAERPVVSPKECHRSWASEEMLHSRGAAWPLNSLQSKQREELIIMTKEPAQGRQAAKCPWCKATAPLSWNELKEPARAKRQSRLLDAGGSSPSRALGGKLQLRNGPRQAGRIKRPCHRGTLPPTPSSANAP